jgi:hypothetical protein
MKVKAKMKVNAMRRMGRLVTMVGFVGMGSVLALGQPAEDDAVPVVLTEARRATLLLKDGRKYDARGPIKRQDGLVLFFTADGRPASIRVDEVRDVRPAGPQGASPAAPAAPTRPVRAAAPAPAGSTPPVQSGDTYTNEDLPPAPAPVEEDASQPPFATEPVPEKPAVEPPPQEAEPEAENGEGEGEGTP